jgi:anti-sigma B factor antagonist
MTQILVEKKEGLIVLLLSGRFIGGDETDALRTKLKQLSSENLIIDLTNVSYMNSTALGILISAQSDFITKSNQIVLVNASDSVRDLLNITQLTLVFKVLSTFEEAKNIINN